jgi:hypothetical protein
VEYEQHINQQNITLPAQHPYIEDAAVSLGPVRGGHKGYEAERLLRKYLNVDPSSLKPITKKNEVTTRNKEIHGSETLS